MRTLLFALLASITTASCVVSNVERFHDGFAIEAGKTFVIEPKEQQKGSMVFRNVSEYVASKLLEIGYLKASSNPDYQVQISYGEGDGYSVVSSSTNEKGETDVSSSVAYTRNFNLRIFDLKKMRVGHPEILFEGIVRSSGSGSTFSKVRKCLIDALFRNFPGESGRSEKVRMDSGCVS